MSAGERIPTAVTELLRDRVETYEQLEVLLALHATPHRPWHADALAEALRTSAELVAAALAGLVAGGLVATSGTGLRTEYRYAPDPERPDDAAAVDALATAYATQRLELVKLMSANAIERVRAAAARTFADAFLLKGGRKDG